MTDSRELGEFLQALLSLSQAEVCEGKLEALTDRLPPESAVEKRMQQLLDWMTLEAVFLSSLDEEAARRLRELYRRELEQQREAGYVCAVQALEKEWSAREQSILASLEQAQRDLALEQQRADAAGAELLRLRSRTPERDSAQEHVREQLAQQHDELERRQKDLALGQAALERGKRELEQQRSEQLQKAALLEQREKELAQKAARLEQREKALPQKEEQQREPTPEIIPIPFISPELHAFVENPPPDPRLPPEKELVLDFGTGRMETVAQIENRLAAMTEAQRGAVEQIRLLGSCYDVPFFKGFARLHTVFFQNAFLLWAKSFEACPKLHTVVFEYDTKIQEGAFCSDCMPKKIVGPAGGNVENYAKRHKIPFETRN